MSAQGGIDLAVAARPENSARLRTALREFLQPLVPAERVEDVVLAAGEATSNAIEHAYRDRAGSITLRAWVAERRVVVEVRDSGTWRLDGDPERGRGLGIMRALVDTVSIESTHQGTHVRLELGL